MKHPSEWRCLVMLHEISVVKRILQQAVLATTKKDILSALADGTKLTPLVLLPEVRPPKPHEIPAGIAVYLCGAKKGSWSNADNPILAG